MTIKAPQISSLYYQNQQKCFGIKTDQTLDTLNVAQFTADGLWNYTGDISLFKQSMNNKELQVLIFDELDHVARHDLDLKQDYLKIGD